ncbi:hypothetical protein BH23BAC2_BH23BAC2_20170 [soil metagenome]
MFKFHNFFKKYKIIALPGLAVLFLILGFLAFSIELKEDISNLIPGGERQEILKKVLENTEFSDKIIVTISSVSSNPNPDELTQYAGQFLDSVNLHLPDYINDIQGLVPEEGIREIYSFVYQNLPLFLTPGDYERINGRLARDSIRLKMADNYKNLISPTGLVTKDFLFKDPLSLTSIGLQKLEELQVEDEFELYNNYLISKDHRHVLLFISPVLPASETNENVFFTNELSRIQNGLNREFDGVEGQYFGGVLYSIANAGQIKNDIKITLGIAGAVLLFILIFYYQKIYVPLLLFIPSLFGGVTALALIFIFKGSISAISLGIGAVLLGISIDYSLHILTHYKKNNNLKKLYREVTIPVLMSSTTTAVAFLCLLFLNSEALNDLGLFAAISVVVASVFALILIPLLYTPPQMEMAKETFIDKLAAKEFHKEMPLVIVMAILFIGGLFLFTGVGFNNDLSTLNYQPEEILEREKNVQNIAGKASRSIYVISYGNSVDEALERNNELYRELETMEVKGDIKSYSSIGGVVLSTNTQLDRISLWEEFWNSERKEEVRSSLIELSSPYGFRSNSFESFYTLLEKDFETIYLEDYQNTSTLYLDDFITSGNNFATVTTSLNVPEDKMDKVLENFFNRSNLVIIDRKQLNESFLGDLKNEFNKLIGYSLIAVFFILLTFYRSIELTLLTLVPIGISWVITLGLLNLFNIDFNILNIIISTFIFGLGLDYSIFMTNAFITEYSSGIKVLKTYRTSILLSVITTLLGIGALLFAVHPALKSISLVSIIGVITAVMVAFVLQGYIFQTLFIKRKMEGKGPFSFKGVLDTVKYSAKEDKLYYKTKVYNNYRYKKDLPGIKRKFEKEKERYLKVADFLSPGDKVLHFRSGRGLLAVYLSNKISGLDFLGIEEDPNKLQVALNTLEANKPNINFNNTLAVDDLGINTVIFSHVPPVEDEITLKKLVASRVKKVIILNPELSYRWIIDLNFEIKYRQNEVVVLQKVD